MAKSHSVYICQQCGYQSPTFLGKCPECGTWNSLVETLETGGASGGKTKQRRAVNLENSIVNLGSIEKAKYERVSTKFSEFDRVLGGGIVAGSVVLVAGDPGIGKSTLLTQLALNVGEADDRGSKVEDGTLKIENGKIEKEIHLLPSILKNPSSTFYHPLSSTLYVAGEESPQQIKLRVERIDKRADLAVLSETDVDVITAVIEQVKPALVIVDSIQTLETTDLQSIAGSVGQVRETTHRLQKVAKALHIPIFIVGHVTKEGTIAGPRTLEHVVDVVLSLEGDANSQYRILRATKNRFGPTDEVGIFDMEESGMVEVNNPSKIFLDQKIKAPGSAVVVTLTGLRPLLLEIQALVTKSNLAIPRRVGTGVDNNRLQLMVAVLSKRLGLPLFDQDVFVNVTGGLRVSEPAIDLGICAAIASSLKDRALDPKTAFIGEVGLLGELRHVRNLEKRTTEAKKLGFSQIISPENSKTLSQAMKQVLV